MFPCGAWREDCRAGKADSLSVSPEPLLSPGQGAGWVPATKHLQKGFDADHCPVLLWLPGWKTPQALELGRNPLQCFMPSCAVLLAAGKGPRNPPSHWAVVNDIVSIVCSPIYSAAKGHTNHTCWKDWGGERWVEKSLQSPRFSLNLKDLIFSPVLDPEYGWQALGRLAASRKAPVKMPETPLPGISSSPCSPSGQNWVWRACLNAEARPQTLIWLRHQWWLASISCLTFACIKLNLFYFQGQWLIHQALLLLLEMY